MSWRERRMSDPMRVAILLPQDYPGASAMASRISKFARGLHAYGAETHVIAVSPAAEREARVETGKDQYGVPFSRAFLPGTPHGGLALLKRNNELRRFFIEQVTQLIDDWKPDVVIIYGYSWCTYGPVRKLCKKRGVTVVADCTEWFPFRLRRLASPLFMGLVLSRKWFLPHFDGMIAISRLWEEYARYRKLPVIRIPAIGEDGRDSRYENDSDAKDPFTLTYMGPMFARDLPLTMLEGVRMAADAGMDIRFVVVGRADRLASGRTAIDKVNSDPTLRECVEFTGWVSDEEVVSRLAQSDALVLLRQDDWASRACFPTRLPEYLLTGKPMILSEVGDVTLYFKHRNSVWFLPPGDQPKELADALLHLASHPNEAHIIGHAGRDASFEGFSYIEHGHTLYNFLARLTGQDQHGNG